VFKGRYRLQKGSFAIERNFHNGTEFLEGKPFAQKFFQVPKPLEVTNFSAGEREKSPERSPAP